MCPGLGVCKATEEHKATTKYDEWIKTEKAASDIERENQQLRIENSRLMREAVQIPALSSSLVGDTPESASKKLISKRSRSPKDDTDRTGSVKISKLPSISESKPSSFTNIIARKESPWDFYEKVLDLDLNGSVTVAQRKARHSGLVAVRAFPVAAAEKTIYMHGRVRHANMVEAFDAFTTETSFFIVLEHMPLSLDQIVQCAKYPTEKQLAAILKQVRHIQQPRRTLADKEYGRSSTA
ncbi:hypothetical protein ACLOAV_001584 [Pseudogymnoascus australis]